MQKNKTSIKDITDKLDETKLSDEPPKVKNRGTGAGGANTNKNGKILEEKVRDIIKNTFPRIEILFAGRVSKITGKQTIIDKVGINNKFYIRAPEYAFKEWEKTHGKIPQIPKLQGSIKPDDCMINEESKIINWLECKTQKKPGSVVEKLQTGTKKIRNLKERFPGWTINYYYILDTYFRKFPAEIRDLDEDGIPYVWNDDPEFEKKILNMIK
jgi:hypothetical protein